MNSKQKFVRSQKRKSLIDIIRQNNMGQRVLQFGHTGPLITAANHPPSSTAANINRSCAGSTHFGNRFAAFVNVRNRNQLSLSFRSGRSGYTNSLVLLTDSFYKVRRKRRPVITMRCESSLFLHLLADFSWRLKPW